MRALPLSPSNPSFPIDFVPLGGTPRDCEDCGARPQGLGFQFDYAYQPIVDVGAPHGLCTRSPGAGAQRRGGSDSVLSQVNDHNRYRFDQACRVKAIKGAAALGLTQPVSINFLPNAIYKPEVCIRTTLEAARAHGFPLSQIIFEVTEGERIEDGPWFAQILREYKRCGFQTAIDDFGAGFAGMKLLSDFQPDIIKIDMDLIRNVDTNRARQAIVRNLVRLCEEMGIQVVAEGIETPAERDFPGGRGHPPDAGLPVCQARISLGGGGGCRSAQPPAPLSACEQVLRAADKSQLKQFWLGAASQAVRAVRQDAATTPEEFCWPLYAATTRLRPDFLAAYSAASARANRLLAVSACAQAGGANADGGGLAQPACLGHCGAHALGHLVGALRAGVGQDHGKFFAAHPRHDVDDPHAAAQHLGDGAQHLVPGIVAEAVIDLLEMVHVQHQQAQGRSRAFDGGDFQPQAVVKSTPVAQAGERVGPGQLVEGQVQLIHLAQLLHQLLVERLGVVQCPAQPDLAHGGVGQLLQNFDVLRRSTAWP